MGGVYLYKLCDESDWGSEPVFLGTADDRRDGFIHLSTAEQVPETFAKYFIGKRGLLLLRVEVEKIEKIEPGLRRERLRTRRLRGPFTSAGFAPESGWGDVTATDKSVRFWHSRG